METVLLVHLFNMGLALLCTFVIFLIILAQGNERKLRAAYFLNAAEFKLAWRLIFLDTVLLIFDEMNAPFFFGELAGNLYATLELVVFLVALTVIYLASSNRGKINFLSKRGLPSSRKGVE